MEAKETVTAAVQGRSALGTQQGQVHQGMHGNSGGVEEIGVDDHLRIEDEDEELTIEDNSADRSLAVMQCAPSTSISRIWARSFV
eukprot:8362129-Pyramimonas_sp.AAC.1